jgi:hypothetical protein
MLRFKEVFFPHSPHIAYSDVLAVSITSAAVLASSVCVINCHNESVVVAAAMMQFLTSDGQSVLTCLRIDLPLYGVTQTSTDLDTYAHQE